jgi:hypothetical protein
LTPDSFPEGNNMPLLRAIFGVVVNKFLVTIDGSAGAASKLAYASAIDIAKLSKM